MSLIKRKRYAGLLTPWVAVISKWQETHFSSVSNFVTGRKISLENVWHIVNTPHFWNECVDEIPLHASFLPPILVAWIWGFVVELTTCPYFFSPKPSCPCVASVFLYIKHSLCVWRLKERTPPVCTWNLQNSASAPVGCVIWNIFVFPAHTWSSEIWPLGSSGWKKKKNKKAVVESLFLLLLKSCTHCKSRTPLPTERWRNVPWSQV